MFIAFLTALTCPPPFLGLLGRAASTALRILEHHFRWTLLKHLANISRSSLFPLYFTIFLIPFLYLSSILPEHGGFWMIVYVPDY